MISRTAENSFWLSRNVERMLMLTNAIDVTYSRELETFSDNSETWFPLVVVLGGEEQFKEKYGESGSTNSRKIQNFLIWDKDNESSLYSSLASARENARIIRDLISVEMWEEINELWLWMNEDSTSKKSLLNIEDFCSKIIKFCFLWIGYYHNFIIRSESYNFMKLGMLLERAEFTLRLSDVHYYRDIDLLSDSESIDESTYWQEMLMYTFSKNAFMRKSELNVDRNDIAEFILKSDDYPRAITFCLNDILNIIKKVSYHSTGIGMKSRVKIESIIEYIHSMPIESILEKTMV